MTKKLTYEQIREESLQRVLERRKKRQNYQLYVSIIDIGPVIFAMLVVLYGIIAGTYEYFNQ